MKKMEAFVADVLDLPNVQIPNGIIVDDALHVDALLTSPVLHANLAFVDTWRTVFGCPPSRIDCWDFAVRKTFHECAADRTPIAALPGGQDLLKQGGERFAQTVVAYNRGDTPSKTPLLRKIAERTCFAWDVDAAVERASAMSLPNAYAYLHIAPETGGKVLLEYESWCRAVNGGHGVASPVPTSVADYHRRSADVVRALHLFSGPSPFSGATQLLSTHVQPLACHDVMRALVTSDGYLWRKDFGGALIIRDPYASSSAHPLTLLTPRFRSVKAPWRIVRSVIPPKMYARLVIEANDRVDVPGAIADVVVVAVGNHNGNDARTVVCAPEPQLAPFWIPTEPSWLIEPMLSAHVILPAADSTLKFHRFVAEYAHVRKLFTRVHTHGHAHGHVGELVVIDTRPNVWTLMSILITLDNLEPAAWMVSVFCGADNATFFEKHLLPRVPHARIVKLDDTELGKPFDLERYNLLLKSGAFWRRMRSNRVLIVQDDGMLVRPGLEKDAELMASSFVGAPWADAPANAALKKEVPCMTGNGGLSLRNVDAMVAVCEKESGKGAARLFNNRMQPVPEDVFFAAAVENPCSTDVAERFAFEQRPPKNGSPPFGFHKPWAYSSWDVIGHFFQSALKDAADR